MGRETRPSADLVYLFQELNVPSLARVERLAHRSPCTLNLRARARTDSSSRSRALRMCSNNSTFDLVAMDHTVEPATPPVVDPRPREDPPGVGPVRAS